MYHYVSLCIILCIIMNQYVSVCIIMYHYVSLCIIMYQYVSVCIIMYHYVSLCIIMYQYVSLCIIMYHYVSLCIIMYHYVSLYIIVYHCVVCGGNSKMEEPFSYRGSEMDSRCHQRARCTIGKENCTFGPPESLHPAQQILIG